MEKTEKVIKGLELCSREPGQTIGCLLDCPYDDVDGCRRVVMREALAMLKEQAARLKEWEKYTGFLAAHGMLGEMKGM